MRKYSPLIITIVVIFALSSTLICGTILFQKPNNDISFQQVINKSYSNKEISALKRRFEEENLSLFYFKLKYHPQCIRQTTPESRYAILLGEEDTRIFVFWNEDTNIIYEIFEEHPFLELEDFAEVSIGETCMEDVLLLDPNFSNTSIKATLSTGHIVKEGIVNIEYDVDTRIVQSVQFFSNDEVLELLYESPIIFIPYVFPQDKI